MRALFDFPFGRFPAAAAYRANDQEENDRQDEIKALRANEDEFWPADAEDPAGAVADRSWRDDSRR